MDAKYVVFDGMDGSGKGTQIEMLKTKFASSAVFTREPGGTPFAEEIRKVVRDHPFADTSTPFAHFLLFWAAREELQHNLVAPALKAGKHVFSDRGDSSTFAFQSPEKNKDEEFFFHRLFFDIRNFVFAGHRGRRSPDLYIILDLPAELARERALQDACRTKTHLDVRDVNHYQRVRDEFKKFKYAKFVDATRTPEKVHQSVMAILGAEMIVP